MLENIISSKCSDLNANDKLVLIVFVARFDRGFSDAMTLADLADLLVLKKGLVASSMPRLLNKGLMKARSIYRSHGRPLREFFVNEEKILALHEGRKLCRESIGSVFLFLQIPTIKISSLSWSHQLPSLDPDERASNRSTVSPQVRRMVEGRKEFLDASNVLLLALLLAASDSVGVVKGWSTRQIGAAIGVTPLALKGHPRGGCANISRKTFDCHLAQYEPPVVQINRERRDSSYQ